MRCSAARGTWLSLEILTLSSRNQKGKSKEQRAKSKEQRAKSKEQNAKRKKQRARLAFELLL